MNEYNPTATRRRSGTSNWQSLLNFDKKSSEWAPTVEATDNNYALLYLRVSTSRQMNTAADIDSDGNSIATQRDATIARCKKLGAPILREFVEPGNSAQTIAKRPVFRELLQYVEDHPEVRYVVIYMRSRAFRNQTDAAITKRILSQMDVKLISAKEDFGDGYMADAMEGITDIMNEVQVRQSGEDIKIKMRRKAENGGTVGRAKVGYLNVRKDFEGRLVNTIDIDPERAPMIKWAFEAYATGEYTLVDLHYALAQQGLTTRPSVRWKAQPVSVSQLSVILRDAYYTGMVPYKGELFKGRHTALIDNELFLKVQQVLAERARRGQRDRIHHHYLKGLLFCERCHQRGRQSRLVYTEIQRPTGTYEYYLCMGREGNHCDVGSLPIAEVEAAITRSIGQFDMAPDAIEQLRSAVLDVVAESQASDREMRDHLKKQLKRLDVREERLLDLAADEALATSRLKERLRTIQLERAGIQAKLERTEAELVRGGETVLVLLDLMSNVSQLYTQSPDSVRRQLLETLCAQIFVAKDDDSISTRAVTRDAVQDLQQAASAIRQRSAALTEQNSRTSKNPDPKTGITTIAPRVGSLAEYFHTPSLSKTALVGW